MSMRRFLKGGLLVLIVAGLPLTAAWATHRADAEAAIAEAKALHARAQEAGVASADTTKLIEDAEALLPSRQFTKAVETAQLAIKQDTFALEKSGGATVDTDSAKAAEDAIAAAESARKKAAAVGGEWRDTAKFIKEAQDLAKAGDFAAAIKLADKARRQGELGYAQAMREKGAGFPDYVMNPK
jgi:hypothetical protein